MQSDDEVRLQEQRSAAGRLAAADKRVVAGLLATPEGRYWVERLLEFCGLYDYDYRGSDELHIGLGRKQVGGYVLNEIETHVPDILARFVVERRARIEMERTRKAEDEKRERKADRPPGLDDMPDTTAFEDMMDQQARELAEKESKK